MLASAAEPSLCFCLLVHRLLTEVSSLSSAGVSSSAATEKEAVTISASLPAANTANSSNVQQGTSAPVDPCSSPSIGTVPPVFGGPTFKKHPRKVRDLSPLGPCQQRRRLNEVYEAIGPLISDQGEGEGKIQLLEGLVRKASGKPSIETVAPTSAFFCML